MTGLETSACAYGKQGPWVVTLGSPLIIIATYIVGEAC